MEVIDTEALRRRVDDLGKAIATDYAGKDPVLVGILKGSVPFLADLVRAIPISIEVDFLLLTRFGSEGRVAVAMDTLAPLEDRHVLIVEDIIDTGLTLTTLRRILGVRDVASLATVALLDKVPRRIVDVPVDYRGFEIGDEFLLGYGMDWHGRYRNLNSIWAVMDMDRLTDLDDSFPDTVFPADVDPGR